MCAQGTNNFINKCILKIYSLFHLKTAGVYLVLFALKMCNARRKKKKKTVSEGKSDITEDNLYKEIKQEFPLWCNGNKSDYYL